MGFNVKGASGLGAAWRVLAAGLLVATAACPWRPDAATSYVALKDAPQLLYQEGVPHTDRQGRMRLVVDANSFLPLCAYEALPGSLPLLAQAGFDCFKPWNGWGTSDELTEARQSNMQLLKQLYMFPCNYNSNRHCDPEANAAEQLSALSKQIGPLAGDPAILAWYIEEEPTACINAPFNCDERLANNRRLHDVIQNSIATGPGSEPP